MVNDILVTVEIGNFPMNDRGERKKIVKKKGEILISRTSKNTSLIDCESEISYHIHKIFKECELNPFREEQGG